MVDAICARYQAPLERQDRATRLQGHHVPSPHPPHHPRGVGLDDADLANLVPESLAGAVLEHGLVSVVGRVEAVSGLVGASARRRLISLQCLSMSGFPPIPTTLVHGC